MAFRSLRGSQRARDERGVSRRRHGHVRRTACSLHAMRVRTVLVLASLVAATLGASVADPKPANAAAPSFVQAQAREIPSGTTDSIAFANANTAGNLIVASVFWNNTGTVAVADSRGNAYTSIGTRRAWSSNWSEQ